MEPDGKDVADMGGSSRGLHSSRSTYLGKQEKPTKDFRQNGYHRNRDTTAGRLHVR
jgi:hypothetical protein